MNVSISLKSSVGVVEGNSPKLYSKPNDHVFQDKIGDDDDDAQKSGKMNDSLVLFNRFAFIRRHAQESNRFFQLQSYFDGEKAKKSAAHGRADDLQDYVVKPSIVIAACHRQKIWLIDIRLHFREEKRENPGNEEND